MDKIDIRIIDTSIEESCENCLVPFMEGDIITQARGFQFCSNDCRDEFWCYQAAPEIALSMAMDWADLHQIRLE